MTTPAPVRHGWFAGEAGVLYEETLAGLISVLEAAEEHHWLAWARRSLVEWRTSGSTVGHRGAYGGTGSFNDLVLVQPASDEVVTVWLERTVEVLRGSAYRFAEAAETEPCRFVQEVAPATDSRVSVARCRSCGASSVSRWSIASAAGAAWASYAVPRLVTERQGGRIADAALGRDAGYPTAPYEERVLAYCRALGARASDERWVGRGPCPSCGDGTAWVDAAIAVF